MPMKRDMCWGMETVTNKAMLEMQKYAGAPYRHVGDLRQAVKDKIWMESDPLQSIILKDVFGEQA